MKIQGRRDIRICSYRLPLDSSRAANCPHAYSSMLNSFFSRTARNAKHMLKHVHKILSAQRDILSAEAIRNVENLHEGPARAPARGRATSTIIQAKMDALGIRGQQMAQDPIPIRASGRTSRCCSSRSPWPWASGPSSSSRSKSPPVPCSRPSSASLPTLIITAITGALCSRPQAGKAIRDSQSRAAAFSNSGSMALVTLTWLPKSEGGLPGNR